MATSERASMLLYVMVQVVGLLPPSCGYCIRLRSALLRLFAQEGDEIVPVLALLQTTESHLGSRNVLLWVLEVLELCVALAHLTLHRCSSCVSYQSALVPFNALLLVCIRV